MLVIREQQLEVLSRAMRRHFEDLAVAHLQSALPDRCEAMGAAAVRASVMKAMQAARMYGLVEEYDILRYLNLMYVLGLEFDRDSRFPWAADILSDSQLQGRTKMDLLMEQARSV